MCIDFETANSYMGSICSVGLAIINDRNIVNTRHWLIRPHEQYYYFDPFNMRVHGIYKSDVKSAPEFDNVYAEIKPLLDNAIIVAHNAVFDISAFSQALELYDIKYPEIDYLCTYKMAVQTWRGLNNYKLNTLCDFLKHNFTHHNAQEDALACGKILLAALAEKEVSSIRELAAALGIQLGRLDRGGHIPCTIQSNVEGSNRIFS